MAYSPQTAVSTAGQTQLPITLEILARSNIELSIDGVDQPVGSTWYWLNAYQNVAVFDPALTAGRVIVVRRETPTDRTLHVFSVQSSGGGSAKFNNRTVDENFAQVRFVAEESRYLAETTAAETAAILELILELADDVEGAVARANEAAENAEIALTDFRNRYQGARPTNPTTRFDGSPLQEGDLYFNSVTNAMMVYADGAWINAGSSIQGSIKRPPNNTPVIATDGQTVVTVPGGYDPTFGMVFLNGVQISKPDVSITNGTSIVFAVPLVAGDEVDYTFFGSFAVANIPQQPASNLTYSQAENYLPGTVGYELKNGGPILASRIGVKGDGVTDNSGLLGLGILMSSQTGREFLVDLRNVGVLSVSATSVHNWKMRVDGSLVSLATKPAGAGVDAKDTHGLVAPVLKLTSCNDFQLSGSYVDPKYREAWAIVNCKRFTNHLDVIGSGLNDNLVGGLYRYCEDFKFGQKIHRATLKRPVGYYTWLNATTVWDCKGFVVTSDYQALDNGANGLYIGSNCFDWTIEPGAQCSRNGMSGLQLAWSSFGVFPQRFSVGAMILTDNRADGLDVNSTDTSAGIQPLYGKFVAPQSHRNGFEDDGSVSPDGSGVGTFMNVSDFDIIGGDTVGSARAGLYLKKCSNFTAIGLNIDKRTPSNCVGEGVYLEDCTNYKVEAKVKVRTGLEALKTYGQHSDGVISGKYSGIIALSAPDANTSYSGVVLKDAKLITTTSVVCPLKIIGGSIVCTDTALYATKDVTDCDIVSTSGYGLIYAAPGVKVRGGSVTGLAGGTNCTDHAHCGQTNVDVSGTNGPASHWINAAYMTLEDNTIQSLGSANSLRIESNCTRIWAKHNTIVGPAEVLPPVGAFDMNV